MTMIATPIAATASVCCIQDNPDIRLLTIAPTSPRTTTEKLHRSRVSTSADKFSILLCPYWWRSSVWRPDTWIATRFAAATARSRPDWAASANIPGLPVDTPMTNLIMVNAITAITEMRVAFGFQGWPLLLSLFFAVKQSFDLYSFTQPNCGSLDHSFHLMDNIFRQWIWNMIVENILYFGLHFVIHCFCA